MRKLLILLTILLSTSPPATAAEWQRDLDAALAQARQADQYVIVDLYAEWCGWCHVLEEQVFSSEPFQKFARNYQLARVDVDHDEIGPELQVRYEVDGLPTILVLTGDGVLAGKVKGMFPTAQYIENLRKEIGVYENLERLYESVDESTEPKKIRALAETFHRRNDGERAVHLYQRLVAAGWEEPQGKAVLPLRLADALRLTENWEEALAAVSRARKAAREAEQSRLMEAADLMTIRIVADQGNCTKERSAMEEFLSSYPESPHRASVRTSLSEITNGNRTDCS